MGGKPVPDVGWVFLRAHTRAGSDESAAMSDAKRRRRHAPAGAGRARAGRQRSVADRHADRSRQSRGEEVVAARHPNGVRPRPNLRHAVGVVDGPVSRSATTSRSRFIEFVAAHPVGSTVEGEVERFSSHGAYVIADGARCYLALKAMGDPAPTSPKDVVSIGETKTFIVQSIDTPRRGVDLAMPARDAPVAEPVSASDGPVPDDPKEERVAAKKAAKKTADQEEGSRSKRRVKKKAAVRRAPAKRTAKKRAPARRRRPPRGGRRRRRRVAAQASPGRDKTARSAPRRRPRSADVGGPRQSWRAARRSHRNAA